MQQIREAANGPTGVPAGVSGEQRGHRRGGAAPDLFLFLWHRIPADRLEVLGDEVAATRYFELLPPD